MDLYTILQQQEQLRMHAAAKHMKTNAVTHTEKNSGNNKGGRKKPGKKPGKNQGKKPEKKQSKKIPKGSVCKKDNKKPRGKTQSTKALKGDDSTLYSLPKKSKEDKDVKKPTQVKKKTGKKPRERLPAFGNKDTVVLMLMGAAANNEEKKVFKNDMTLMRKLFQNPKYFGIKEENVISISSLEIPKDTTMRGYFMKTVKNIQEKLKKTKKSRFIFYYTGHFSDDGSFWIENAGTPDDDLKYEDLKKAVRTTSAEYIVFLLDCCFSGKVEIGAKKIKKTYTNPPIPQLWDIGSQGVTAGSKGNGSSYTGNRKTVQVCSSHAGQTSGYGDKYSYFTQAIHEVITHPTKELKKLVPPGTFASVLQIFREVKINLELKQKAVIMPETATRAKYFETFPVFTKLKPGPKKSPSATVSSADSVPENSHMSALPTWRPSIQDQIYINNFQRIPGYNPYPPPYRHSFM